MCECVGVRTFVCFVCVCASLCLCVCLCWRKCDPLLSASIYRKAWFHVMALNSCQPIDDGGITMTGTSDTMVTKNHSLSTIYCMHSIRCGSSSPTRNTHPTFWCLNIPEGDMRVLWSVLLVNVFILFLNWWAERWRCYFFRAKHDKMHFSCVVTMGDELWLKQSLCNPVPYYTYYCYVFSRQESVECRISAIKP